MKLPSSTPGLSRATKQMVILGVLLAHAAPLAWLASSPPPLPPAAAAIVTVELLTDSHARAPASQPAARSEPGPQSRQAQLPATPSRPARQAAALATPPDTAHPLPAVSNGANPAPVNSGSATVAAAPAPAAIVPTSVSPAPAKLEPPSANADYLNNPKPTYPPLSRRLREEGKVVLRVLIESDGTANKAEIHSSSGYERLDQAALQAVLRWRYLPARRNGVAEAAWFNVPLNFVLE